MQRLARSGSRAIRRRLRPRRGRISDLHNGGVLLAVIDQVNTPVGLLDAVENDATDLSGYGTLSRAGDLGCPAPGSWRR